MDAAADAAPQALPERAAAVTAAWGVASHVRHGCIEVARVASLPPCPERSFLEQQGSRSWLCVPLWRGGRRAGLLGFDTLRHERRWLADDVALLRTAGEILSGALDREEAAAAREALETRLRQTQRMEAVGTLAGGIAHDFNNILGAILGYAEMVLAALPAETRQARHVRQIVTAGERAMGVVDQILAFSRRGERERRPILIEPVVAEALALLRASLPASVSLEQHLAAAGAAVDGDPSQIQQVVLNLCTNAAQAMAGAGQRDGGAGGGPA